MEVSMRKTKIVEKTEVINGNDLVANVFDEKQISSCVDQINDLPESPNSEKVLNLKKKIESGEYDWNKNLDEVVNKIIDESSDPNPIAYPIFD
tara:strand:+ start:617 stop:895 length:279 start_codon:yes stop_codon:yes gene_type:complete